MPVSKRVERLREERIHTDTHTMAQIMLDMLSPKRINTSLAIKVSSTLHSFLYFYCLLSREIVRKNVLVLF